MRQNYDIKLIEGAPANFGLLTQMLGKVLVSVEILWKKILF